MILDKKKRKLQFAFQAETPCYFDSIFTIDDSDIKDVKRAWKLGKTDRLVVDKPQPSLFLINT